MNKIKSLLVLAAMLVSGTMWAQGTQTLEPSTEGTWEHQYRLRPRNSNGDYWLTKGLHSGFKADAGKFAFVAEGTTNNYYVYSVDEDKWLTYSNASNGANRVTLSDTKSAYFTIESGTCSANAWGDKKGYTFKASSANVYMNFYEGPTANDYQTTGTIGFWEQGLQDAGSVWVLEPAEDPVVADKFYRLKNKKSDGTSTTTNGETHIIGYMDATAVSKGGRNFAFNGYGDIANATFSQVFQFVPSGDNYYLKAQGSYMSKLVDGSVLCTENQNDAALFSITATTNEGYYYLVDTKQTNNTCKYAQLSDYWGFGIGGWNPSTAGSSDDLRCQWAFEAVESVDVALTTVGEASYATLYAPYAVSLDSNVKAYTATVSGDKLVASEVTGVVPAFTAVILVSESKAEKAVATLVSNSTAEAPANDLLGVCRATAAEGALVLGDNEGIGFYSFSGATLGANKAYYTAPAASNGLRISFGELTGIISAAQQNGGQAIFDLQGRRVVEAKGLNIVNGKKVIR